MRTREEDFSGGGLEERLVEDKKGGKSRKYGDKRTNKQPAGVLEDGDRGNEKYSPTIHVRRQR